MHWNFYEDSSVGAYIRQKWDRTLQEWMSICAHMCVHIAHLRVSVYACMYRFMCSDVHMWDKHVCIMYFNKCLIYWVACAATHVACVCVCLLMCGQVMSWTTFACHLCTLRECLTVHCIYCTLLAPMGWVLHNEKTTCAAKWRQEWRQRGTLCN